MTWDRLTSATAGALLLAAAFFAANGVDVSVDYNTVVHTLADVYHGVNYVALWDGIQGSPESAAALRRGNVELIRFPGGEPANWLDWDLEAGSYTPTTTDDIGAYAKSVGATILYSTNPTTNEVNEAGIRNNPSGQHWADLVTYCKDNDVPVTLWEVGNEPDMQGSPDEVQWYWNSFNDQAAAIHAAHPGEIVMGPAVFTQFWGAGWLERFVELCDQNADAISIHFYPEYLGWTDSSMMRWPQDWPDMWSYIRSVTQKPVYITEWTLDKHPDWYHVGLKQFTAVAHADMIGSFAKTGVAGHTFFGAIHCITDNWGILASNGCADGWVGLPAETPSPSYFLFPMWHAMGKQVLNATHGEDAAYVFNAWAHKKPDGSVQVMLLNKREERSQDVTVTFDGFDPTGCSVGIYETYRQPYNGDTTAFDRIDTIFYNGVRNPFPATDDLPPPMIETCSGSTFSRTVPPISVTVLDFYDPSHAGGSRRSHAAFADLRVLSSESVITVSVPADLARSMTHGGIYDMSGRLVKELSAPSRPRQTHTWHAELPAPGVYAVRVSTPTAAIVRQFTIAR